MCGVSQRLNVLQVQDLSFTVALMPKRSEDVRLRIRDEMARQKVSQRDVADLLGWSQSKVAHILTGHVEMNVDDLAEMCSALRLSLTEAVRDRGLEFCADLTPTELRMLERLRQLPAAAMDAVMLLLDIKKRPNAPERHAGIQKK